MKLTEVWEEYENDKILEGYSESTLKGYKLQKRLFIREVGDLDIREISRNMVKSYLSKESKRLKPSSILFRIKFFRTLWRYASDEGYIEANPMAKLRNPKIPKRKVKIMDEEDIEKLRISCVTTMENALLELFFASGCRVNEVHHINIDSIDFRERSIEIVGKGNKERTVFFGVRCSIWLKKYLNEREDDNKAMFVTERKYKAENGQPRRLSKDGMRWTLKRIARRAEVGNLYPHKLRHSFAMHMLRKGTPMTAIQSYLGHEKIETTRIYADYDYRMKQEIYRKYF